jgi:hypothetical protein
MLENITYNILGEKDLPFPVEDVIKLTGLTGIHPVFEKDDNINIEIFPYGDCVKIDVTSTTLNFLQVVIYFTAKHIDNKYIRKNRLNTANVAVNWVNAQTSQASERGYSFLIAEAFKDDTGTADIFCGYIIWGKMGYIIVGSSVKEFENLMREHNLRHTNLHNLLSSNGGLEFWTKKGFSWEAKFDLKEDSESFRILNAYKRQKGIA